jgi:hypothetical protein
MFKMILAIAAATLVGFVTVLAFSKSPQPHDVSQAATSPAPQLATTGSRATTPVSTRPSAKDIRAGMVIDGATALRTSDLWVDWKDWLGKRVMIRGRAYGAMVFAGQSSVGFSSSGVSLRLARMDSETERWFLRECHGIGANAECESLVIMGTPENGQAGRQLVNVTIVR